MPGFDGTGPMGYGPMTGWRRGFCAWQGRGVHPSFQRYAAFGGGRGRGWRNRFYATGIPGRAWWDYHYPVPPEPEEEMEMLKGEATYLESELKDIRNRIEKLQNFQQEKRNQEEK